MREITATEKKLMVKEVQLQPGEYAVVFDPDTKIVSGKLDHLPHTEIGQALKTTIIVPEKRSVFVGTKTEIEGKIRDEGVKERVRDKKVKDAR